MSAKQETYYIYRNAKELNATGVHEIKIDLADLETVHKYTDMGWRIVGDIRSEFAPGELYAGLTAMLDEALLGAKNTLDIIWKYIREWNDRDMERKYK